MKLASLKEGQFVETGGYYTKGDAGQAKYLIVAAQAVDGWGDHTLANGAVAKLVETSTMSIEAFGVDLTGVLDSTAALQAVADTRLSDGINLDKWSGSILLSDTVQFRDNGVDFEGSGMDASSITMTDDTKFALDLFAISTSEGTFKAKGFALNAKFGIKTRWDITTNFETEANPIKRFNIEDIRFSGTYDPTTDVDAGTDSFPSWISLANKGIGFHSAMNYRTEVKHCEFKNHGIGLSSIGSTLCKFSQNKFQGNSRALHEERTLWSGSAFGLGADNIIEQNDFLDSTRRGMVTLVNTFGDGFRNNYLESLDRSGQLSTPTLLELVNCSHNVIEKNHFNPALSVAGTQPYIDIIQNGTGVGEASNNRIFNNRLTPQTSLENATIDVTISAYDRRYPVAYYIYSNVDFPTIESPYIINSDTIDRSKLSYSNLDDLTELGGTAAANTLLFTSTPALRHWHLPTTEPLAGTANLTFDIHVDNFDLSANFEFVITADDNATGDGRLNLNIQDETGYVYNATPFTGITSVTTTTVAFTGGAIANKVFSVDLTNMAFSKVYSFKIRTA